MLSNSARIQSEKAALNAAVRIRVLCRCLSAASGVGAVFLNCNQ
jgi:hypothetical protein